MLKPAQLLWAVAAGALLASGSVQAQQSPDWARCIDQDRRFAADIAFGACSNVISSGTEAGEKLAIACGRRGNVYHDKGEYDRAIADYTKAIEMNPRDAVAYSLNAATHCSEVAIGDMGGAPLNRASCCHQRRLCGAVF